MENTIKSSFFEKEELGTILSTDERFKGLKDNEQRQILNVLAKDKGEHGLKSVALSIVMDVRGY